VLPEGRTLIAACEPHRNGRRPRVGGTDRRLRRQPFSCGSPTPPQPADLYIVGCRRQVIIGRASIRGGFSSLKKLYKPPPNASPLNS
jgi:hypothetical protein